MPTCPPAPMSLCNSLRTFGISLPGMTILGFILANWSRFLLNLFRLNLHNTPGYCIPMKSA